MINTYVIILIIFKFQELRQDQHLGLPRVRGLPAFGRGPVRAVHCCGGAAPKHVAESHPGNSLG